MLYIDPSNRDKALRRYPHGPARITLGKTPDARPIFELQVGAEALLVATARERLYLENYALLKGWEITR